MSIYDKASLVQIPSGYKSGTLYSVVPNTADGDFTVTGDPQGEATRVNKDGLIETVSANVPRLNYDPSSPQDPHLLLEPERTNIAQNSNELNTGWAHSECTLTPNQVVAPDGSNTGSFVERTSTIQARVERGINLTDQNYTWSCFVKKGNQRYAFLNVYLVTSAVSVTTIFDFDTESIVFSSSAVIANSVVEYSNGWYRLTTTFDALASQTAFVKVGSTSSTTVFSTGNVGDTIYVWGAQLEAGSYPTSYTPTSGSAVTRTVDKCLNAGSSSLFNDTEGTLFVDLENFDVAGGTEVTLSNGFSSNRVVILFYGTDSIHYRKIRFFVSSGTTQVDSIYTISYTFNQRNKIAFRYKQNDFKAYINGTQVFSDTSGDTPVGLSRFDFANFNATTGFMESEIYQAMVFNEALSNSELETITSYRSFNEMAKALLYTIE